MSNTATSSPVTRSRKWNSGADMPPLGLSENASSLSPSSTSIATVGGCTVAARWSSAASGSASSSVTGMPFLTSASVITAPTGPAPTTITRLSCCVAMAFFSIYTREISNIEGWNSSSTVTLRSIRPCSCRYCASASISRMFSWMP